MATATTTTAWTNATAADFRAWGSWISGLFTTFGWVNVYQAFSTGTGWTDVSAPAGASDMEVAEIWRMDDALQSTAPLYMKVEYGSGTSGASNPGMRFTIGTGHDGAGNITGTLYTGSILTLTANANVMTHYASGASDRFAMAMATAGTGWASAQLLLVSIERRKDGTGANVGTGFLFASSAGSSRQAVGMLASAAGPVTLTSWGVPLILSAEANLSFDSKVAVAPLCFCLGPAEAGLGFVGIPQSAYSVGATFTVSMFGSNHTYIATESTSMLGPMSGSASALLRPAMRYE